MEQMQAMPTTPGVIEKPVTPEAVKNLVEKIMQDEYMAKMLVDTRVSETDLFHLSGKVVYNLKDGVLGGEQSLSFDTAATKDKIREAIEEVLATEYAAKADKLGSMEATKVMMSRSVVVNDEAEKATPLNERAYKFGGGSIETSLK